VMKRSQGPSGVTGISHLKMDESKLKTCEDHTFRRERYGQRVWDSNGALFINLLIK
jgi:hypothetical protein